MWVRRISLATILLVLANAIPAAAQSQGEIELRGVGNSYVDISFSRPVTIRFPSDFRDHFEASTNGDFVGFAVQRLPDKKVLVGGVWVRRLDLLDGRIPARLSFDSKARLQPGRYRFVLLAQEETSWGEEGHASVTIPVNGLNESRSYRLRRPAKVDWRLGDYRIIAGQPGTIIRQPIEIRPSSTTLLGFSQETDYGQISYATVCVTPRGNVCEQSHDPVEDNHVFLTPGSGRSGMMAYAVYARGKLEPGAYEAHIRMAAVGWTTKLSAFLLILD